MSDYLKVQEILTEVKSRARRYTYDLSAQLAADSSHYRHGEDDLLDEEENLKKHIAKTTTSRPQVSLIGAVNPQQLPGADYIPSPHHSTNCKECKDCKHHSKEREELEEEVPDLRRAKLK